jgi:hypothetical protein
MSLLKIFIVGIENERISTELLNLALAFFKCFQIVCELKHTNICLISNGSSGINYIPIKLYNHSKKNDSYDSLKIFLPCKLHGLNENDEDCIICNLTENHSHFEVNSKDIKTPGINLNTEHSNLSKRIGIDTVSEIDKSVKLGSIVTTISDFTNMYISLCSESDIILFFIFEDSVNSNNSKIYNIISRYNNRFIIDLNKIKDVVYFKSVIDSIKIFLKL